MFGCSFGKSIEHNWVSQTGRFGGIAMLRLSCLGWPLVINLICISVIRGRFVPPGRDIDLSLQYGPEVGDGFLWLSDEGVKKCLQCVTQLGT